MLGNTIWDICQAYRINELMAEVDTKIKNFNPTSQDHLARDVAFRLEEKLDRLALICRAMFELMEASTGITEEQLRQKIVDVDARDGQADNRMTPKPKRCPKCDAMMSPRFGRCLFCGYKDQTAETFA